MEDLAGNGEILKLANIAAHISRKISESGTASA